MEGLHVHPAADVLGVSVLPSLFRKPVAIDAGHPVEASSQPRAVMFGSVIYPRPGMKLFGTSWISAPAAGGQSWLYEELLADGFPVKFTLTDKYSNVPAFRRLAARHPSGIDYLIESVDATKVPMTLTGFRTMFNSFHHFDPSDGRQVLRSAIEAHQPIGVFEIPERSVATIIPLLFTPLYVVIATLFIRPFQWRRLLWTYALPLVPLTCWWDGLVSQFRAYTVSELKGMTRELGTYDWEVDCVPIGGTPGNLTYLVGIPKSGPDVTRGE